MTAVIGYNMADLSVKLFETHEASKLGEIRKQNAKLDKALDIMEKLNRFIALFNQKSTDSERVIFDTAEERDLLDDLRNREEVHHLFPPKGTYEWKGKTQIEDMRNHIGDYIGGPLQTEINMLTQGIALEQHELTQVLHIFQVGLTRMLEANRRIIDHTSRGR